MTPGVQLPVLTVFIPLLLVKTSKPALGRQFQVAVNMLLTLIVFMKGLIPVGLKALYSLRRSRLNFQGLLPIIRVTIARGRQFRFLVLRKFLPK